MNLRDKKIKEVLDALYSMDEDIGYAYYYDRNKGEVISIDEDLVDEEYYLDEGNDFDDSSDEGILAMEIMTDVDNRFVPITPLGEEVFSAFKYYFVRQQYNEELTNKYKKICNRKSIDDDFFSLLEEFDLEEAYEEYEVGEIKKFAEDILTSNHIIEKQADLKLLRNVYETAEQICNLKPWEKFADLDVIKIENKIDDIDIYVSILGNSGNTYGFVVYFGEGGLNSFSLSALARSYGIDFLIPNAMESNYTIFFDNPEDLLDEDIEYNESIGYKHVGKMVPSIYSIDQGYFISRDLNNGDCKLLVAIMETLMAGLSSPLVNDEELEDYTYRIELNEDSLNTYLDDKIILSFTPNYEFETKRDEEDGEVNVVNKTYEIHLSVVNEPIIKEEHVTPLWVFQLVVYNQTDDRIVNVFQRTNETGTALEKLQFDLMRQISDNEIGSDIVVNNPIVEAMVEPYADICSITIDEPSNGLMGVLDYIQQIAAEKDDVN